MNVGGEGKRRSLIIQWGDREVGVCSANVSRWCEGSSVLKQRDATTESYQSEDSRGSPAMLTPMLGFLEASASPPLAALHSMTEMKSPGGNPHGIDHILSRPPNNVTTRGLSVANMAAAAGMAAASYKHHLAELTSRSAIYWPGLQGLVSNPIAWRDRLANSKYCLRVNNFYQILGYGIRIFRMNLFLTEPEVFIQIFMHRTSPRTRAIN